MRLLSRTSFKNISTKKCIKRGTGKNLTRKFCNSINRRFHTGKKVALEYVAKLNVPLMPKQGSNQIVLGTTKYLLPYVILTKYFKMFSIKPEKWTMGMNMSLIECIAKQFIENDIIRFVTTPADLIDKNNNYRVTAQEICMLKQYNYNFYKYNSSEYDNIYFCSKVPLTKCILVDTSDGAFRCAGSKPQKYLYF